MTYFLSYSVYPDLQHVRDLEKIFSPRGTTDVLTVKKPIPVR